MDQQEHPSWTGSTAVTPDICKSSQIGRVQRLAMGGVFLWGPGRRGFSVARPGTSVVCLWRSERRGCFCRPPGTGVVLSRGPGSRGCFFSLVPWPVCWFYGDRDWEGVFAGTWIERVYFSAALGSVWCAGGVRDPHPDVCPAPNKRPQITFDPPHITRSEIIAARLLKPLSNALTVWLDDHEVALLPPQL